MISKLDLDALTRPGGIVPVDVPTTAELVRQVIKLRDEIEVLLAALKVADDSIRHHLRCEHIAPAMIQPHAVRAIRNALAAHEQGSDK